MTERAFRSLDHPDDLLRQARAVRGARIDKLGVDRSRWAGIMPREWSGEAESKERDLRLARAEVTIAERTDAWRRLFALTGKR